MPPKMHFKTTTEVTGATSPDQMGSGMAKPCQPDSDGRITEIEGAAETRVFHKGSTPIPQGEHVLAKQSSPSGNWIIIDQDNQFSPG
jgi:hypothetical protein